MLLLALWLPAAVAHAQQASEHVLTVAAENGVVSSTPAGIACPPVCAATLPAGNVSLTAQPLSGYRFARWEAPCRARGNLCQIRLLADTQVGAVFEPTRHALVVTLGGSGRGRVISAPAGIDCGASCTADFATGASVVLTATPESGSRLVSWTGACTSRGRRTRFGTSGETCQVTMSEAREVTAIFDADPGGDPVLTVLRTGSGTVTGSEVARRSSGATAFTCAQSCTPPTLRFEPGTALDLTATPDAGWRFVGWLQACTGTGTCRVTMNGPLTVEARFEPAGGEPSGGALLSAAVIGAGRVVSSFGISCPSDCAVGDGSTAEGQRERAVLMRQSARGGLELRAEPAAGARFERWNGCPRPAGDVCAVTTLPDSGTHVEAVFSTAAPPPLDAARAFIGILPMLLED